MDPRSSPDTILYKRWRNPDKRDEENFVQQSDEDLGTNQEICTITTMNSGIENSVSRSGSDQKDTFTIDEALEAVGFGKFQCKLSVLTGLSWIGDAMEMMILSILSPELHCQWRLPGYMVSLITSVVFIGMGISSPLWGNLIDNKGRRVGLIISMSWILYFGLLSAFAPVYGWILFLRTLVGFGIAGAPQSVTLYSEFLPIKTRGTSIVLISMFWSIGAVFEVLLAMWIMPTLGWRWLLGLSTVPMAIFICFSSWLPESPRFDMLNGNPEKAMATLKYIAEENGKALPQGKIIAPKQKVCGRMKDVLSPQYGKTTLLLWFIWFANAFSYYGLVLLTTELFQSGDACGTTQGAKAEPSCSLDCKYLTSADYKDLLWTTLAEFPGLLFVLVIIELIGRKKSMALCFFMFALFVLPLYACIGRTALTIFIFISRAFISGGFQVAYVYTPEVYPTEIRALALGTCSAMARIGALITPFVAQVLLRKSVYLTLSMYCGCCLLAGITCLILPIETLGRGLQESNIDQESGVQSTTTTSQPCGAKLS